jgi:ribose transport system permease protein
MSGQKSYTLIILAGLWVVVVAGLAILQPSALALSTVTTVLQFSTILGLVALGQGGVILCGGSGIDLSVGGIVSLASVLATLALGLGLPPVLLPAACILIGLGLGVINGLLVTGLGLLPLIATLGTFYI